MDTGLVIALVGGAATVGGIITKAVAWVFHRAVEKEIDSLVDRVLILETRQKLLWGVAEQRALETLHHTTQPDFDQLIEQFQSHELTDQQLTQFIERLQTIIENPKSPPHQVPAARVLLNSALRQQDARVGLSTIEITDEARLENIEAARSMAREANDHPKPTATEQRIASEEKLDRIEALTGHIDETTVETRNLIEANGKINK